MRDRLLRAPSTVIAAAVVMMCVASCRENRGKSAQQACIATICLLDSARETYATDHTNTYPSSIAEMSYYVASWKPKCPKGGTYSIDSNNVLRCSRHGTIREQLQAIGNEGGR